MISTPGHRALRRRQRRALPAWLAIRASVSQGRFEMIHFGSAFATAQPVARARCRRYFALNFALSLLARIVLLDLAVFFTWGPDLSGMGHFLADILNGGHRLGAGKRYRFSGTPSEAARYGLISGLSRSG